MTFTQLSYIVTLAEEGNFARASKVCNVTQPTLSMQIHKLEEELGVVLFDRSKHPILPTQIGESVIQQARLLLYEADQMHELIANAEASLSGNLRLGVIPTLAPYLLPRFLPGFTKAYPNVNFLVNEFTTESIIQKLRQHKLDIGLMATPLKEPDLHEHPVFYEELLAYFNENHPIGGKNYLLPEELNANELLLMEEGHCMRSQVLNLCNLQMKAEESQNFRYESGNIETLKFLVDANQGITIIPELSISGLNEEQLQSQVRHFKGKAPVRQISLVTYRHYFHKQKLEALRDEIQKSVPSEMLTNKNKAVMEI